MSDEASPFADDPPSEDELRVLAKMRERKKKAAEFNPMSETHRMYPMSPDAEKGVLSSFLLAPREIGALCVEKKITSDHFYIPTHALIYSTLLEMWDKNEVIDFITLTQYLRDRNKLDQAGGAAFITELFTWLPTAANAGYYMKIVEEKRMAREGLKICYDMGGRLYTEQDRIGEVIDEMESKIMAVRNVTIGSIVSAKQAIVEAIGAIEEIYAGKGQIIGMETGFPDLDKLTDGLHGGEMFVIAARPSQGKTALAMNIAEHIAIEAKKAVAVFSLEMSYKELWKRLLCSRARVNLKRVRDGFLAERDFPALQIAASKLAESKLFIDDTSGLSIQELKARARRLKQKYDIAAIFVDYLQLLHSTSKHAQNSREREVADVSGGLKHLAKELGIPVVVLCQINRKFDERASKGGKPRLSDLRESGAIEQDADAVAFLTRDETNPDLTIEERKEAEGKAELFIAKQRNGPVGDVYLTFLKEYTRFETRACLDDDEIATDSQGTLLP